MAIEFQRRHDWDAVRRRCHAMAVALMSAGAYGFAMASNYNTRPRAVEVMVDGAKVHQIRRRETVQDLFRHELAE